MAGARGGEVSVNGGDSAHRRPRGPVLGTRGEGFMGLVWSSCQPMVLVVPRTAVVLAQMCRAGRERNVLATRRGAVGAGTAAMRLGNTVPARP